MGVFAWCAIIGCTVLVAGILFDGLLDALLPDGLVPILALPVAVFGAIGMGVTATTGSAAAQVPAAVLWGVPTAVGHGSTHPHRAGRREGHRPVVEGRQR